MVGIGRYWFSPPAHSVCVRPFKERKYPSEQTSLQASRQFAAKVETPYGTTS